MSEKKNHTIKKTLKEIADFRGQAEVYLNPPTDEKSKETPKMTMGKHVVQTVYNRIEKGKFFENYLSESSKANEDIANIQTNHQAKDSNDHLLYNDAECKIRKYTGDGEIACRKEIGERNNKWKKDEEVLLAKEVVLEPFIYEGEKFLASLTFKQIEAFRGFVIPEDYQPQYED
jgi:hypothetical protein